MKTTLTILFLLFAVSAFGQSVGVIPNQGPTFVVQDHALHADYHAMATENSLIGGQAGGITYAQGERPLWEFGPFSTPTPLGDVARAYRKEKLATKKAEIVFEKQGS